MFASLAKKGYRGLQSITSPPAAFDMADPVTILAILKGIAVATTTVYRAIDKLNHEEQQTLKDLSRAIKSLKSDTAVYETLLNAMENDITSDTNECSPYKRFIQR